jgi:hypothetical protein
MNTRQKTTRCFHQMVVSLCQILLPCRSGVSATVICDQPCSHTLEHFCSVMLFHGTEIGIRAGISSKLYCKSWDIFQVTSLQLLINGVQLILMARGKSSISPLSLLALSPPSLLSVRPLQPFTCNYRASRVLRCCRERDDDTNPC